MRHAVPRGSSYHVLLMGTDRFTLPTLVALHDSLGGRGPHAGLVTALTVLCPGDRPTGRGQHSTAVPVKTYAASAGLRTVELPYGVRDLRTWDATHLFSQPVDVGVVVSFGYLIPPSLLDPLRLGAVNLHPSLLPAYRGAAPIQRAILAGETTTGLSVIDVHRSRFDAGAILAQVPTPLGREEGARDASARLADEGCALLMTVLADLPARRLAAVPQLSTGVSAAPKLRPEEGALTWSEPFAVTCGAIMRRYRAMDGSYGIHCYVLREESGKVATRMNLTVVGAVPDDGSEVGAAKARTARGSLVWDAVGKRLLARTTDGWLVLQRLTPETRSEMSGEDYANGMRLKAKKGESGARLRLVDAPVAEVPPPGAV